MRSPTCEIKLSEIDKDGICELQVLREGTFQHPWFGAFEISQKMLGSFCNNFKKKILGVDIALDYGHNSGGEAAGWFTDLQTKMVDGKSCLYGTVKLTPTAQQKVMDKEYRYVSADFTEQYIDNENKNEFGPVLYGAALTNRPFVKDMDPVMQLSEEILNEKQGENKMELELLRKENAELKAKLSEQETERKLLSDAGLTASKVVETIKAKDEEIKKLSEETEANKKAAELAKKESEFAKLLTEGKAVPAQKDAFLAGDLEKFVSLSSSVKVNTVKQSENLDPKAIELDAKNQLDARNQIAELTEKKLDEMKLNRIERSKQFATVMKQVREENPELSKVAFGK